MAREKGFTIGVIGSEGKYGKWLRAFFEERGYKVVGSDLATTTTNEDVVRKTDIVIFTVPIHAVVSVVESVIPFSRSNQLWMDVTSIKGPAVEAMLRSKAEVVGLHPMCAPSTPTLKGQTLIVCKARISSFIPWLFGVFLLQTEAVIQWSEPREHDHSRATDQALPHAVILAMASVLRRLNVDLDQAGVSASPFYRLVFSLMGRILSQSPELYGDIQMCNPHVPPVLRAFEAATQEFRSMIETGNMGLFLQEFKLSREFFGEERVSASSRFFDDVIRLLADLSDKNIVVIEATIDSIGLGYDILGVFERAGINLTSFHSQRMGGEKLRFLVGVQPDSEGSLPNLEVLRPRLKRIKGVGKVALPTS